MLHHSVHWLLVSPQVTWALLHCSTLQLLLLCFKLLCFRSVTDLLSAETRLMLLQCHLAPRLYSHATGACSMLVSEQTVNKQLSEIGAKWETFQTYRSNIATQQQFSLRSPSSEIARQPRCKHKSWSRRCFSRRAKVVSILLRVYVPVLCFCVCLIVMMTKASLLHKTVLLLKHNWSGDVCVCVR